MAACEDATSATLVRVDDAPQGDSHDSQRTEDALAEESDSPDILEIDETDLDDVRDQAVVLMRAVLEEKPYTRELGIGRRWEATAEKYNARIGLLAPAEQANVRVLQARLARLYKLYGDPTTRSELAPELLGLVAQYHTAITRESAQEPNNSKRRRKRLAGQQPAQPDEPTAKTTRRLSNAQTERPHKRSERINHAEFDIRASPGITNIDQGAPGKRRRHIANADPPAALFKLDLHHDTRMVRAFLDRACFIDQEGGWVFKLLETAAVARGEDWSRDHARSQLDRLTKLWATQDPGLCVQTAPHQRLCSLLRDYADCILKLSQLRKEINRGVGGGGRTLDDLLLEYVGELKPFKKQANAQEQAAWNEIATRFNTRLGMRVMFTGRICATRFQLLREAKLAGGAHESVRITQNQDKWLCQIEQAIKALPNRSSVLPTWEDDDYHEVMETTVIDLVAPPPTVHITSVESKELRLLLREVVAQRPFDFRDREMLVWEKIRAHVNFDMGRETILSKEACRARVVNLCRALQNPHDPEILRLYPAHLEPLRGIVTRDDLPQQTMDHNEEEDAVTARVLPTQKRSDQTADTPSSRGESGTSRGNGSYDGAGDHNSRSRSSQTDCDEPSGRNADLSRGRSACCCERHVVCCGSRLHRADSTLHNRLEQRIEFLSDELATIKRALRQASIPILPRDSTEVPQPQRIPDAESRVPGLHDQSSAVV